MCAERQDGAGRLLAAAVKGSGHGLHSRAGAVLDLLLQEELLAPEHFSSSQVTCAADPTKFSTLIQLFTSQFSLSRLLSYIFPSQNFFL